MQKKKLVSKRYFQEEETKAKMHEVRLEKYFIVSQRLLESDPKVFERKGEVYD